MLVIGFRWPYRGYGCPRWGLFHRVRSRCSGSWRGKVGIRFSLFLPSGVLVIGLSDPVEVMDALVRVNSIGLGPDVLGPSGVRLGFGFPCSYPRVFLL